MRRKCSYPTPRTLTDTLSMRTFEPGALQAICRKPQPRRRWAHECARRKTNLCPWLRPRGPMRARSQCPATDQGRAASFEYRLDGPPKKRHTNQYRQWVLCTTQHLCDLWNQRILYGLGLEKNSTEFWHFEPGKPPKLIQKLPIGIP